MMASACSASTDWPGETFTSFNVPATGATMGISIFIASMTMTTSSSSTCSPTCFSIFKILPTIGASTVVANVILLLQTGQLSAAKINGQLMTALTCHLLEFSLG